MHPDLNSTSERFPNSIPKDAFQVYKALPKLKPVKEAEIGIPSSAQILQLPAASSLRSKNPTCYFRPIAVVATGLARIFQGVLEKRTNDGAKLIVHPENQTLARNGTQIMIILCDWRIL